MGVSSLSGAPDSTKPHMGGVQYGSHGAPMGSGQQCGPFFDAEVRPPHDKHFQLRRDACSYKKGDHVKVNLVQQPGQKIKELHMYARHADDATPHSIGKFEEPSSDKLSTNSCFRPGDHIGVHPEHEHLKENTTAIWKAPTEEKDVKPIIFVAVIHTGEGDWIFIRSGLIVAEPDNEVINRFRRGKASKESDESSEEDGKRRRGHHHHHKENTDEAVNMPLTSLTDSWDDYVDDRCLPGHSHATLKEHVKEHDKKKWKAMCILKLGGIMFLGVLVILGCIVCIKQRKAAKSTKAMNAYENDIYGISTEKPPLDSKKSAQDLIYVIEPNEKKVPL
jgi:hypothetical protein